MSVGDASELSGKRCEVCVAVVIVVTSSHRRCLSRA